MLPCRGSYFALASYVHLSDESDYDFAVRLTKEASVASVPVSVFYGTAPTIKFSVSVSPKEETLERAVERLVKV